MTTYALLARMQAFRIGAVPSTLVSAFFYAVVCTALGSLWFATAGDDVLDGYSAQMLVWYIVVGELVVTSVNSAYMVTISDRINDGEAATLMSRPVHPGWWFVAEELGPALLRIVVMIPVGCLVGWLIAGRPPQWIGFANLVVTLPLAVLMTIILNTVIAAATFWLGDSRAIAFLHQKIIFLVGGMLIPAELCPAPLDAIFPYMPWSAIAYAPARAFVAADSAELLQLVALQLFWVASAVALLHLVFARGQQRMAVGGG